jgi:hypothetical protein
MCPKLDLSGALQLSYRHQVPFRNVPYCVKPKPLVAGGPEGRILAGAKMCRVEVERVSADVRIPESVKNRLLERDEVAHLTAGVACCREWMAL